MLTLMLTLTLKSKALKSFKSFSDEAYGFITCGAEPPHKVKVNVKGGGNPYLWGRIPSGCGDFFAGTVSTERRIPSGCEKT
jgi:hypothetical protein